MKHLTLALGLILTLSFFGLHFAAADCAGTVSGGNDTITCTGTDANGVDTGAGNDSVEVQNGAITQDGIYTQAGNDTVIITNANLTGASGFGDALDTGVDDDTVIVSGNSSILGVGGSAIGLLVTNGNDFVSISGNSTIQAGGSGAPALSLANGNDTAIVSGNAVIIGGNRGIFGGPNDDLIIVSDNVSISGLGEAGISGNDGNDTIRAIGNATITRVGGNAIDAGNQNDQVTIAIGVILNGTISGGADTDILTFEYSADTQEALAAFAALLASQSPAGGTLTVNGLVYNWANFEQLSSLLTLIVQEFVFGEVAPMPALVCDTGLIKVFRLPSGDLDVFAGFDLLPPNGFLVGRVDQAGVLAGITRFQDTGEGAKALEFGWSVLIQRGNVTTLQVVDANGNPISRCTF